MPEGIEGEIAQPDKSFWGTNILTRIGRRILVHTPLYPMDKERKGLRELIKALEIINLNNCTILCIGAGELPVKTKINVIKAGTVNSNRLMSILYSCADYFVMPSYQEGFAQTPMEAMACGTPVIAFPCSGAEELITDACGVISKDFTIEALVCAIRQAMQTTYDRAAVRESVVTRFNYDIIAKKYIHLYETIMSIYPPLLKILFDHQAFSMQTHGGVSRSFAELYRHLPTEYEAEISIKESNNAYIKDIIPDIKPKGYAYDKFCYGKTFRGKGHLYQWIDKFRTIKHYPDYNKSYSIHRLKLGNFDIFHPTYFDDYFLPYLNGKPFVLTIHDMIPELYPQYFPRDDFQIRMKRKLAPIASAIIAVSENTKKDAVRILNIPEEKIHVIYHGCSFPNKSDVQKIYSMPYIIYVGDRYGYKDFDLFVKHISEFLKNHQEIKVVCTGKPFRQEEKILLEKYECKNSFINHWVNTDEEFFSLYHHALCFIYTSEYEGFGIPILEAYKANCPVFLNNSSCFPEIAGDAAVYFNMSSEFSNLSTQIEEYLLWNAEQRQNLIAKQNQRLKLYSWNKAATELAEVYKFIA